MTIVKTINKVVSSRKSSIEKKKETDVTSNEQYICCNQAGPLKNENYDENTGD